MDPPSHPGKKSDLKQTDGLQIVRATILCSACASGHQGAWPPQEKNGPLGGAVARVFLNVSLAVSPKTLFGSRTC